jgi:murein DD-endopeptidase MepM/ murein hydrolase activator NlpD
MGRVRRKDLLQGAFVLIFSIGFGAGVATIRLALPPDGGPGTAGVAATAAAGPAGAAPAERSAAAAKDRPGAVPSTFERAAPRPAMVELPAADEFAGEPQLAAMSAPLAAIEGLGRGARMTEQARLEKAVLSVGPPAEQIVVQRGDTLMNILTRAGIGSEDAYAAVRALVDLYDPRRLRAGQELLITAVANEQDDTTRQLLRLAFDMDFDHEIRVSRDTEGVFSGEKLERPQRRELVRRAGIIDDSLYLSAGRAEVPQNVMLELIKLFSWDVDFQRDIHPGDAFEATFEEVSLEGERDIVRRGDDLLHARLTLGGRELDAYRFERQDGSIEYFDRTGRSLRKFLLRTPVDGARISSRFGLRQHPILGYSRMHKGVDFAAPSGTPIYAAGGGRVAVAGRNGGYGNYIRITHNGEYATAYAHLSRFAKGVKRGGRVRQGQVIGYVGTTGRSTGPHLHYEVLRHDAQINPLKLKHPALAQLSEKELEHFQTEVARIDRLRAKLQNGTQIASRTAPTPEARPAN